MDLSHLEETKIDNLETKNPIIETEIEYNVLQMGVLPDVNIENLTEHRVSLTEHRVSMTEYRVSIHRETEIENNVLQMAVTPIDKFENSPEYRMSPPPPESEIESNVL